jgi:hypothetical protein
MSEFGQHVRRSANGTSRHFATTQHFSRFGLRRRLRRIYCGHGLSAGTGIAVAVSSSIVQSDASRNRNNGVAVMAPKL